MSTFVLKAFRRFAKRSRISADALRTAATEIRNGWADVDLGGGVYKHRVARHGGGKSGGFRLLVAFRRRGHLFFVDGFAKNERSNLSPDELEATKRFADLLFSLTEAQLGIWLEQGSLERIDGDD